MKMCVAIVLAIMSGSLIVNASENRGAMNEMDNVESMISIQRDACLAHEKLFDSFEWEETYIYPEDFAGDYIEYNILYIQVTNEQAVSHYKELLKDYEEVIEFEIVENSYEDLYNETEAFAKELSRDYGVVSYTVDVKENKGLVNVIASDYEAVMNDTGVMSAYTNRKSESNLLIEAVDNYVVRTASLVGGTPLSNGISSMTLGGSGLYGNATAFITCGHGLSAGDRVNCGGTQIGKVAINQFANNQYGDFSIITAASSYTPTSDVFTSSGNITHYGGYLTDPAVGTYLYSYGAESGQCYGVVTERNVTSIDIDYGFAIKGLTEMDILSGSVVGGDSGGPFRNDDYFCGVLSGGGNGCVVFTPYKYIYNAGFQIEVN